MKWISEYCTNAKYILKVDDDIIANPFIVMRHLKNLLSHNLVKTKTLMCLVWTGMPVIRQNNSKWYIPKEEFKEDYYGKYCSGSAYVCKLNTSFLFFRIITAYSIQFNL